MTVERLRGAIDAAEGRVPADTLFVNARIVDVYGHRIAPGRVAVRDGVIVGVCYDGRDDDVSYEADRVVDLEGRYLAPGLIDGHLHIESSNVRPAEYARMALARGTTTAVADSHEICNVCGLDGLSFMMADARRAPLDIEFMMPSCVPALPDEQAGASITAADMEAFIAERPGEVFGLGEMMNMPGVTGADPETCARIAAAAGTVTGLTDGHAPLVSGRDLNAYTVAGIIADHECTEVDEALDKLSRGMYIMLREGTCSHDLAQLVPLVLEDPARARRCCFATDDRAPSDALAQGMIDNACRMAVEAGIDPVTAVSMATLSTAECFGLDHGPACPRERRGAVAPGKRADLLVLDDLSFAEAPAAVYAAGALVAEHGRFVGEIAPADDEVARLADELRGSVHLPGLSLDVFSYPFRPGEAVIDVIPGNAVTGVAHPESADGLRRIALIERHGRGVAAQQAGADGDGPAGLGLAGRHIGRGWVRRLHDRGRGHRLDDRPRLAQRLRGRRQPGGHARRRGQRASGRPRPRPRRRGRRPRGPAARRPHERGGRRGGRPRARAVRGRGARHGDRAAARPHHGHDLPAAARDPDAAHPPRGDVRRDDVHLRRVARSGPWRWRGLRGRGPACAPRPSGPLALAGSSPDVRSR